MTKNRFNKIQVFLSASSHGVTDLYASFVIGLIPIFMQRFDLTLFMVSLMTAINAISNSLSQPIFGHFADKIGIKYFLIAGPLFASIFMSFLGLAPNYYVVLILLFVGNISISAFHPASAAVGRHFGGKRRVFSNSIIAFGGNFGYALGSLFIIFIVEKLGLKFTPVTMIPGIIMALILLRFVPSNKITKKDIRGNDKELGKIKLGAKEKASLAIIIFTAFTRGLTWISLSTFIPVYLSNNNIRLTNIGLVLLVFGIVGGIGGLLTGYYSDRIKNISIIIQLGYIFAVPLFYFTFRTSGILSLVLYILGGFFLVSTLPLTTSLSQTLLPKNSGLASSLVMGFSDGIAALFMLGGGRLADNIGIVGTMNYVLLFPLLAFILLFIFRYLTRNI